MPSCQTFGNISNHVQSLHQEGRRVNSLLGPKDTYRYVEYPNEDETLTFAQILNGMKSCWLEIFEISECRRLSFGRKVKCDDSVIQFLGTRTLPWCNLNSYREQSVLLERKGARTVWKEDNVRQNKLQTLSINMRLRGKHMKNSVPFKDKDVKKARN